MPLPTGARIDRTKGGDDVKFRVEREVLADAVAWVARGLPNRPPVPVLSGVLIEADRAGTITLSAFDYEVSAKVTVAADVDEGGTVLVTGRLLAEISRALPSRPVDVTTEGNKVTVTCGTSRFSLLMMQADDYPTLPASPQPSGTIAGDVFTQAVAPGRHRGRPRRHPADPHRRPDADRGRQGHPAGHRPLPTRDA
jgi:DNA polymerase-3 subunit beta